MAGNSAIWRDNNLEASSTDKIEFDIGVVPDNTSHITQTEINLVSAVGVNPKPKKNLDELQDTFVSGVTWIVTGSMEDPENSLVPIRIKEWLMEAKTATGFSFGRFGIRLDDFPDYNVRQNDNRGLFLVDWRWIREGETKGKVSFIAILRLNANATGLNAAGNFNWETV